MEEERRKLCGSSIWLQAGGIRIHFTQEINGFRSPCPDCSHAYIELCGYFVVVHAVHVRHTDYPDYCELPINAAFTYLVETGESEEVAAAGAPELTACYLWRKNKIIFAFDPELTTTLAEQAKETEETDILPADLLLHPPYPIIYVKAPGLVEDIDGFFYWVDYDTNHGTIELRIQWVISDFKMSFGQVMHLLPGSTIHDCVWDTIERTKENLGEPAIIEAKPVTEIAGMVITALQFVLYLCASNADIREDPPEVHIPDSDRHKKVMTIQDKAREVKSFSVGIRIGAAIRKA